MYCILDDTSIVRICDSQFLYFVYICPKSQVLRSGSDFTKANRVSKIQVEATERPPALHTSCHKPAVPTTNFTLGTPAHHDLHHPAPAASRLHTTPWLPICRRLPQPPRLLRPDARHPIHGPRRRNRRLVRLLHLSQLTARSHGPHYWRRRVVLSYRGHGHAAGAPAKGTW